MLRKQYKKVIMIHDIYVIPKWNTYKENNVSVLLD